MRWEPHVRFGGGCEETISRKADMAPRSRPHQPWSTMLNTRARSVRVLSGRRCSRQRRTESSGVGWVHIPLDRSVCAIDRPLCGFIVVLL